MVTAIMAKKAPATDGRTTRYAPVSLKELQDIRDELKFLSGMYIGICSEMEECKLAEISVDGLKGVYGGLQNLTTLASKCKGELSIAGFRRK